MIFKLSNKQPLRGIKSNLPLELFSIYELQKQLQQTREKHVENLT